jgi:hypothetical protein
VKRIRKINPDRIAPKGQSCCSFIDPDGDSVHLFAPL